MNLENFKHNDWIVYWAGGWSLLSDSYFGKQYMRRPYMPQMDIFVPQVVFLYKDGRTTTCIRESAKKEFCTQIQNLMRTGKMSAEGICGVLKKETDNFLSIIKRDQGKDVTLEEFQAYVDALFAYYTPHVIVKNILDVLSPEELEKYADIFEQARIYAESVFSRSEEYINTLASLIAKKTGYQVESILALLYDEFEEYLKTESLPSEDNLRQRHRECILTFDHGTRTLWQGEEALKLKKIILGDERGDKVEGQVGYPGKAIGPVKIVLDPQTVKDFKEGDVLVAEMTRPEYLPLMKKASAFVTDGGGVLCHVAIVAREMKKPCIIGTKVATKIFKNGDKVEVDAKKGIVKKI